ncbi:MAG: 23S rRNA (adenine(2503)-C(2))-methyltransferase [Candidatus Aminicenantes bacterium RBG_16_63_14]|nr:MAG: 23S rRNA (adenine(2503)-C(2))-methyltransferase [Candidatus Aminicenantes bacterium RBG_16_63_14]OGD27913.1 MAG: 23S rRNA (adenine(2503)-C(2))-methyltransferase [Candidatus Aminicenantes bacterium RBG_19FT_COMBO_65_30]
MKSPQEQKDIRDLSLEELRAELERMGERPFRASQIFDWLYKKRAAKFEDFTSLSKDLREKLASRFRIGALELADKRESSDGTTKFLFRLRDGEHIETVLIAARKRLTVCLSTQVGCKFACAFCASGLHGFKRNLAPSEITGQVLYLQHSLGLEPTNFVFMGMGEPLDNWANVEKALRIMNAPEGLGIAARRLTVSTAGFVDSFKRLAALDLQVNLSLSLHAVTDRLRDRLMPINRRFPLEEVVRAAEEYVHSGGRMITLEYIVIRGLNDSLDDADGLAAIARRLRAKVNLIAYSPVEGREFETPTEADVARFKRWLEERKVNTILRLSKGSDIAAACGQLAGRFKE